MKKADYMKERVYVYVCGEEEEREGEKREKERRKRKRRKRTHNARDPGEVEAMGNIDHAPIM